MSKDKLVLLIVALGFLFLVAEARYAHAGIWMQEPKAYIPIVTCGIGFVCCLAGLAAEKRLATFLGWFLLALSSVGPLGVYFHTKGDLNQLQSMLTSNTRQERLDRSDGKLGGIFNERPLLAPMSISGLAMVAGISILGNRRRSSST
ncbi:MAG: hypothetical protein ACKVQS_09275 [Fimbriimonadaceae bacterium]